MTALAKAKLLLVALMELSVLASPRAAGLNLQLTYTGEIEGLTATATIGFEDVRIDVNPPGFFLVGERPAWARQEPLNGRIYIGAEVLTSTARYSINGTVDGTSDWGYADAVRIDVIERFLVRLNFPSDQNFVYLDRFTLTANPLDGGSTYLFILAGQPTENHRPQIDPIPIQAVVQQHPLSVTLRGTDSDAGQLLTFSLDAGSPVGASITAAGVFTWTPSTQQAPGDYIITVRLTDNGQPPLNDAKELKITVQAAKPLVLNARLIPTGLRLLVQGGEANQLFKVQASSDLATWTQGVSLRKIGNEDVSYDAPASPSEVKMFYRVLIGAN